MPLVVVVALFSVGGDLLLPSDGIDGFVLRAVVLLAIAPALVVLRVVTVSELKVLVAAVRSSRAAEAG